MMSETNTRGDVPSETAGGWEILRRGTVLP